MEKFWWMVLLTVTCALISIKASAKDNAVVLLYHHVSTSTPKVTSVSPETFRSHMQYLADNHQILPLADVIKALKNQQPLPENTVVITFDDGYENIFTQAHPILKEFDFPYTVFINPPLIGKTSHQLDWQQISIMAAEKATFANHGKQHGHLLTLQEDESTQAWLARVIHDIEDAETLLKAKLGYSLKYFAYPYGEFDKGLKLKLQEAGYIGFGQQSGAIASFSDFAALPRFPAAGIYSDLQTLKVKLSSLAMPVSEVSPDNPKAELPMENQKLSFAVANQDISNRQIDCFQNGSVLEKSLVNQKIIVTLQTINQAGRHRINCTAASLNESGRFYWYSHPIFIATDKGEWLD